MAVSAAPPQDHDAPVAVLIVAAGAGLRAGGGLPKQYRPIAGRSALARCMAIFAAREDVSTVLTAIRREDAARYDALAAALAVRRPELAQKLAAPVFGGCERQETARLGLERLASAAAPPRFVAIHDAARPFAPQAAIDRAFSAARRWGGACAALPLADTLRRGLSEVEGAPVAGEIVPRDGLYRAQTPQVFAFAPILAAHRAQAETPATDDAEIARRAGLTVRLTEGAPELMKITAPADFAFAAHLAAQIDPEDAGSAQRREARGMKADIRVGQGFDVHRFGPNADGSSDHVMLCGVRIAHETGLSGHSDADVGLHALTDAVLAAAALGDIGRHFPPSEARWRAAASDQFLAHAMRLAREAGGEATLLDVTLICERPKIGPHAEAMRARIAEIAAVEIGRVSVKATTSEKLGFTGRGEGIAAMATASFCF
ncbi:MAG: 2-C-methyl-D-erythritol 2,4-cyclodiphosphate synthase [Pseudomonadota bacterium]